jgi:DNA-directed RNA polymerase subunit RPC12/RpoP
MGVMRGYHCKRCSLAFEIGGYVFWELDGQLEQTVCRACGTMHRLTERDGTCEVTALSGPVRGQPLIRKTAEWYAAHYDVQTLAQLARQGVNTRPQPGEESTEVAWPFTDKDWEPVGQHPGGIAALGQLACTRCGAAGQMQSLTFPPHPDGFWLSFRDVCPLCDGPMPSLYDNTVN